MPSQPELERVKRSLTETFVGFLADQSPEQLARFRTAIETLLDATPETDLLRVVERVARTGDEWGYFPPEQFARHVHRAMADAVLTSDSGVEHAERLQAVQDRPLLFLPNHISYSDANLFDILLFRAGLGAVVQRLTVIAGPKVYSDPLRRFLSLCFGTIKTAQSASRASGEAVMSAREVAAVAKRTIELTKQRLDAGDALLIFAEGSRSRDATMQPLLAGVARYFDHPRAVLVPVGITGTERLIGVREDQLHPTRVVVHFGEPIEASELFARSRGKRQAMTAAIGHAIATTLPPAYRGVYGGAT